MAEINRLKEQARSFYQKAEWEKARRAVEQILSIELDSPEFSLTLGNIYLQLGDDRQGLDLLEKALRLSEKFRDFGRVIASGKRILSIDKDRIELYNKIAEGYLALGLKSGAIREWLRYADQLKIRSDFTALAAVYQRISEALPENPALRESYQRIRQLTDLAVADNSENAPEPADIVPYRRLVDVALKMGQAKKIVETQLSYARVLTRKGFHRKARSVYQKILERDPSNEEALAKVLSSSGEGAWDDKKLQSDLLEACKAFQEKVWDRVDEAYEPYFDLGLLFRQEFLKDEAIIEFQGSIKGGSRQLKGFEMLAVSFLEQGDFGLAKEVLSQGLSIRKFLDNEYVGLHYNLGLAHEQLGDFQKALYEYEQVYIIDINYKDVSRRLRSLESRLKPQDQTTLPLPDAAPAPAPEQTTGLSREPEPAQEEIPGDMAGEGLAEVMAEAPEEGLAAEAEYQPDIPAALQEEAVPSQPAANPMFSDAEDRYAAWDEPSDEPSEEGQKDDQAQEPAAPEPDIETIVLGRKDKGLSFL